MPPIAKLPIIPVPQWLTDLTPDTMMNGPFPLRKLLRDSFYYPASGFHGGPVKYLGGNILSFVYVDYGFTRQQFGDKKTNPEFLGYDCLAIRPVTIQELALRRSLLHIDGLRPDDGDPSHCRDWIKGPFCDWCVFQRKKDFLDNHGPDRFSLLYLCADGVAAFQALYMGNFVAPKAVAVIHPGGGNWTDFRDPEKILARNVRDNPGGRPEILYCNNWGPCWPDYQTKLYCGYLRVVWSL